LHTLKRRCNHLGKRSKMTSKAERRGFNPKLTGLERIRASSEEP
jgi:hypothetical protein